MGPRWRVGFPPQPFLFRPRAGGGDGTGAGRPQVWWRLAAAGHDGRRPGGGLGRRSRLRGAAFPGGQAAVRALLWDLLLPPRAGQQGAADHLPMAVTIMILYVSKLNKIIHFPDFDKKIPVKLFPLPLLYIGNHISGLWSTSKLSSDLAFNLEGYIFVFLNDLFTAANGVYTKQKMDPKELGKYGVLFYNACFMIIPTLILSISTGDLRQATEFNQWKNVLFIIQFLLSCFLGFLLMYSTVLCSYYNSALTTAVVGAIKNVSIAYIGMLVGGDYIFSVLNFVGLNICMAGGLRYSFLTLSSQLKPKQPVDEENIPQDLKG
ncbi:UDP-N-acetylglucosamine/UDP-glucose/GDP-mannose transporter isoform X6 [Phacochoerus africanus]|uniref:UDP-N-acetylglucosamine/UDP-glucose/GDP-mannose transporter isoform X6 n=1 Tax=Phacochoerus africanus TaxID=41426 RepID=UPI001FDA0200|nr:UDP-N-acetylglucosamine/UDP-glucose/GDP-mannose transporter isoform X6 [Phacochoerus africanus]